MSLGGMKIQRKKKKKQQNKTVFCIDLEYKKVFKVNTFIDLEYFSGIFLNQYNHNKRLNANIRN